MTDQEKENSGAANNIDISKILLPKKEGAPSAESAQRINAGALLAQEEKAQVEGLTPPPVPVAPALVPSTPPASAIPTPKAPKTEVQPIQTFQGDIESLVQKKDVSVVSIAAAEADRAGKTPTMAPAAGTSRWMRIALIVAGVVVVAAGVGLVVYVFLRDTSVNPISTNTLSPFITADAVREVPLPPSPTRASVLQTLNNARAQTKLSLGLIERLVLTTPGQDADGDPAPVEVPSQDLFAYLATRLPASLLRTIEPTYLVGVHSYDENQLFLIANVDSYELAYAGLLEWESTMYSDLQAVFKRTPPVRLTGSATSTEQTPAVILTGFVDKIVENRDVRAKVTDQGDLLLFWTFLNRSTVLIATNEFTLREVISRFSAPVQTVPSR